jgi:hypothetical protein
VKIYFDPSFLISLYLPEATSAQARAFVEDQSGPIYLYKRAAGVGIPERSQAKDSAKRN